MPVILEGSCHCARIAYSISSHTPVPYQLCCCSICRKVGGYIGSVNVMGDTQSLKILKGEEYLKEYKAVLTRKKDGTPDKVCTSKRFFCSECSSMLWLHDEAYTEWTYPFASSIDSPSPLPSIPAGASLIAIMRDSCPTHVPVPEGAVTYGGYGPGEGIEAWHKEHGVWVD